LVGGGEAAQALDPGRPLAEQGAAVRSFFERIDEALRSTQADVAGGVAVRRP
jgi:hypothetical protein